MQIKLPLLFSVLVLSLSRPVFAQQKGADVPAAPSTIRGAALRGFELGLRPAYGSAGGGSPVTYDPAPLALHPDPGGVYSGDAAPYGAGLAGEALVGYRFAPFASAGAFAEVRTSSADAPRDGTTDLSRSAWGLGVYARGYAPMLVDGFDPYLQLGVGYMQDTQTYRRNVATTVGALPGDWTLTHHGVSLPVVLGIDYQVSSALAVGPSVRYAHVLGAGGCLKERVSTAVGDVSASSCTDASESQRVTQADSYGVWSAGLDLRLTL